MQITGLQSTLDAIQRELEHKQNQAVRGIRLAANECKSDVKRVAMYKTGTYRRSIHVEPASGTFHDFSGRSYALIGSDAPQTKRLEFGFDGKTDSIGRTFHQKPRPHWDPTLKQNLGKYHDIIEAELNRP